MPSAAIRSPGRTTTTSPTLSASAATSTSSPSRSTRAVLGRYSSSFWIARWRRSKRERFEAFADQGDEDDLGGDEVFAEQARRDAGDRQRDVGADPPFEQRRQGEVDHPPAADDRRDSASRTRRAARKGSTPSEIDEHVAAQQHADDRGGEINARRSAAWWPWSCDRGRGPAPSTRDDIRGARPTESSGLGFLYVIHIGEAQARLPSACSTRT